MIINHALLMILVGSYKWQLILVELSLIFVHIRYQCPLMMKIWMSTLQGRQDFETHYYTESLRIFFKFYFFAFVFTGILVRILIEDSFYLVGIYIYVWLPQITWNFFARKRNAPQLSYVLASSLFLVFFALYFRLNPYNFLLLRP
mmetsp:Transcript_1620/g.1559  ORF Transcript_1620/g.1559 Transcript_1620/m.1559 type:complete len:145 (-) Transcript_1620:456-890(-)